MGKREKLLKDLPKPVKEFFNSHWGNTWEDKISLGLNPKASYFAYSFWGENAVLSSKENLEQVEDIIREKINAGFKYGFDLLICDSEGKQVSWELMILFKKSS